MTLEEFKLAEPLLAVHLCRAFGHCEIDGVFQDANGRWEAHLAVPPNGEFEIVREARCLPNCRSGPGYRFTWVGEDHVCCAQCEIDPTHHYETVHE